MQQITKTEKNWETQGLMSRDSDEGQGKTGITYTQVEE